MNNDNNELKYKSFIYFNPYIDYDNIEIAILETQLNDCIKIYSKTDDIDTKYEELYNKKCKKIMISVKNNKLCRGIKIEYIIQSLQQDDILILLMCPKNRNVYGFATLEFKCKLPNLFIELMATNKKINIKGYGRILINLILQIGNLFFVENIKLKPIQGSINFYKKMGFINDTNDTNDTTNLENNYLIYKC